jgi:hypothetical protein
MKKKGTASARKIDVVGGWLGGARPNPLPKLFEMPNSWIAGSGSGRDNTV